MIFNIFGFLTHPKSHAGIVKSEKTTNKLRLSCAELRKVSETLRVNKLVAVQSVYGQQY